MNTIKCAHCGARNYVQVDVDWMSRVRQLEREHAALLKALEQAHEDTCSLHCPSVWPTGEEQPHSDKCKATQTLLSSAQPTAGEREATNK